MFPFFSFAEFPVHVSLEPHFAFSSGMIGEYLYDTDTNRMPDLLFFPYFYSVANDTHNGNNPRHYKQIQEDYWNAKKILVGGVMRVKVM